MTLNVNGKDRKSMREKRETGPLQKRARPNENAKIEEDIHHNTTLEFCDATPDADSSHSDSESEHHTRKDTFAQFDDSVTGRIDADIQKCAGLVKVSEVVEGMDVVYRVKERSTIEEACASVKQRLVRPWMDSMSQVQKVLLPMLNSYADIQFSSVSSEQVADVREVYCLHAVNHVMKTRDVIMKNTLKVKTQEDAGGDIGEYRDQGFTRPRVLILAPFKNDCWEIVRMLERVSGVSQVDNLERFTKEYTLDPTEDWVDDKKSKAFQDTFKGNIDDCFRVGVRFARKNMKVYSDFYSSDVLVCSPLGLRMIIGAQGSIEVVILDKADTFHMQNWEHVLHCFDHLNLMPLGVNDTDYSRVKGWYLDGKAKYMRQTVVCSGFVTPGINALVGMGMNVRGRIKMTTKTAKGAIAKVHVGVPQLFQRIRTVDAMQSSDARFEYFKASVLSKLTGGTMGSTILFIPSYFDYVRVRNYLTSIGERFSGLCEYSTGVEISRERLRFFKGELKLLILTERLHFFKRGARHVVFYQLPEHAEFYEELVNRIDVEGAESSGEGCSVSVMWDYFDAFACERVVGSDRFRRLIEMKKDAFVFNA